MSSKDQGILLSPPAETDLATLIVVDLDFVHAPIDKVENRKFIGGVLVQLLWDFPKLVRHLVRRLVTSFAGHGEIAVESRNRGRVAVVVKEEGGAVGAG